MAYDPHQNVIDAIRTVFFEPCVAEVRILKAGRHGTVSGYFELPEHEEEMVSAVEEYTGEYNVYWTINPVHTDLMARACNRTKSGQIYTTDDSAILKRVWLPIDIDPVRFAGISASNDEKAAARDVMQRVIDWLRDQGWPEPAKASSGNGYHLLYRIDLPNDQDSEDVVKSVLSVLASKYDDDGAKVDTTLYNASRILKAYGTVACKGDSTPHRPHRYAQFVAPPSPVQVVSIELLRRVADQAVKEPVKQAGFSEGGWTKELVQAAFASAGIKTKAPQPFKGGLKWQHDCWSDDTHKSPDAFTTLDGKGWVSYKCSHNSCGAGMNSGEWVQAIEEMAGCKIKRPRYNTTTLDDLRAKFLASVDDYEY